MIKNTTSKIKYKYNLDTVQKAREFFEAMSEARKAMEEYDKCDGPDSDFWKVPERIQERYYRDMEAFGKFLA